MAVVAAKKPKHKLYVINDNTIVNMAKQERFLKEFPFLKSMNRLNQGPKKKKGCCRSSNNRVSETFAAARRTLAGLPRAKKQKLKELLGATQLRIVHRGPGGKMIQLTF